MNAVINPVGHGVNLSPLRFVFAFAVEDPVADFLPAERIRFDVRVEHAAVAANFARAAGRAEVRPREEPIGLCILVPQNLVVRISRPMRDRLAVVVWGPANAVARVSDAGPHARRIVSGFETVYGIGFVRIDLNRQRVVTGEVAEPEFEDTVVAKHGAVEESVRENGTAVVGFRNRSQPAADTDGFLDDVIVDEELFARSDLQDSLDFLVSGETGRHQDKCSKRQRCRCDGMFHDSSRFANVHSAG